jgi:hypothetical protein
MCQSCRPARRRFTPEIAMGQNNDQNDPLEDSFPASKYIDTTMNLDHLAGEHIDFPSVLLCLPQGINNYPKSRA